MARRKRPRAGSPPDLVRFEEPKGTPTGPDASLIQLARRMRVAEQALDEAMDELAEAERRFAALPEVERRSRRTPAWFTAARDREGAAGDALESIYRQIAQTPARTKTGLALKLQLVALLFGENADEARDDEGADMVSYLIQSLIADVTER